MSSSKTVFLEREDVPGQIRRAVEESEIPEGERVLLCSPRLLSYLRYNSTDPEGRQAGGRLFGARPQALGYLEDRKIIVTSRETARRITGK